MIESLIQSASSSYLMPSKLCHDFCVWLPSPCEKLYINQDSEILTNESQYTTEDKIINYKVSIIFLVSLQVRQLLTKAPKDHLGNPLLTKRLGSKQWVCSFHNS